MPKLGKNLSGQIVANTEITHTMVFFCQANSKAPKVEQIFPYATCNNHSFVVLFVD